MHIDKGLVIDRPWIDHLLKGEKTWEMRSTNTSRRGWFGLIRKGSGHVVGVARLVGVGIPLSPDQMVASFEKHRIPEATIRAGAVANWNIPWMLSEVTALPRPVPYVHKPGAVTWVNLDQAAISGIAAQMPVSTGSR